MSGLSEPVGCNTVSQSVKSSEGGHPEPRRLLVFCLTHVMITMHR